MTRNEFEKICKKLKLECQQEAWLDKGIESFFIKNGKPIFSYNAEAFAYERGGNRFEHRFADVDLNTFTVLLKDYLKEA